MTTRDLFPLILMDNYFYFNPNPNQKKVGDCAVRAISKAINCDWNATYLWLCLYGYIYKDMPNGNAVWGEFLKNRGFKRHILSNTCPDCYNLSDFCAEHPNGTYVVVLSNHVATVINGVLYDSWDSRDEIPIYYWEKE